MALNFQNNDSRLFGRVLFAVLLVVALVLTTVYAREGESGPLHSLQDGVRTALAPLGYLGAAAGSATGSVSEAAGDLTADASTLSALREQNAELRELLAGAEEYRLEAERLEGLLNMKTSSNVAGVTAHVTGRSVGAWSQSVTIDVGTADGVASGMAVMGASGVVGQVSRAGEHASTVRLLSDPNSGAAVMIQSSRANGIVRGSLEGLLYLEDIDEKNKPQVGDVIVTSGLGGSYPSGLLVGTVVSVGSSSRGAVGSIVVDQNDASAVLEEVMVVTGSAEPAASDASTATASAS